MTLSTLNAEKEDERIPSVGTTLLKETGDSCAPENSLLIQIFLTLALKGK